MTYSIVAADPDVHEVGVATQSKFLAVGAVVPWARGDVGAVATQSFADATFGPRGLELLASGVDPQTALDRLLGVDEGREQRQVGVVDAVGRSASFTGTKCFEHAASITGPGFACQGNILAAASVVPAMAESFERSAGRPLADRLVEALRAAEREGGDRRGRESAAILVAKPGAGYGGNNDRYLDLRVDHHDDPIEELARLLELHRLYFERPRPSDLVEPDGALEEEIRIMLNGLGRLRAGQDVWEALEEYMSWENLEERWVGRGQLDPRVLEYLRAQVQAQ
ncbi:MAG: DUF1028 domain-containing protein [Actinobacteria bacterium]|nr:MAG: DUF1028 domain-containing protein [Actinomycetota bacterium]